jgi:hypothetical protein
MKDKNLSATDAAAFQSAKNIQTADSPLDYDMYDPKKVVRSAARPDSAPLARTENRNKFQTLFKAIKRIYKKCYQYFLRVHG